MVRGKHSLNFFFCCCFSKKMCFLRKNTIHSTLIALLPFLKRIFINAFFSNDKGRKTKSRRVKLLTAEFENFKAIKKAFDNVPCLVFGAFKLSSTIIGLNLKSILNLASISQNICPFLPVAPWSNHKGENPCCF